MTRGNGLEAAQWLAELLRRSMELPIFTEVLWEVEMDLVVYTATSIPEGSHDKGTTGSADETLLVETENTP